MLDVVAPTRSAEDILSRVVRVTLGGQTYELPVRSIRANREWKNKLGDRLNAVLGRIQQSDNAEDSRAALVEALSGQTNDLIDLLLEYDTSGVLPNREAIEDIEPDATMELIVAVREVMKAANPLVATALARRAAIRTAASSPPTSSPPVSITGRRRKSKTDSATSNSSPTSTPPPTGSATA